MTIPTELIYSPGQTVQQQLENVDEAIFHVLLGAQEFQFTTRDGTVHLIKRADLEDLRALRIELERKLAKGISGVGTGRRNGIRATRLVPTL